MTAQGDLLPDFLFNGPVDGPLNIALAHGAGAPMDSPFVAFFAEALAERGYRVIRFEFPYMAHRRSGGKKRPPDRADKLLAAWRTVINAQGPADLIIGGKSLGGRMASLIADSTGVRGLVCLGYPFHPPGKPVGTRTEHLACLTTPTLICQGGRDPFGNRDEVPGYSLSPAVDVRWLEDGDHGFRPRVRSGRTERQNWDEAVDAIDQFATRLVT